MISARLVSVNFYSQTKTNLGQSPKTWLVTGVAGFIGSNLLEQLLKLGQRVVGLDNFSTGKRSNLNEVGRLVTPTQWQRFRFIEGDICSLNACKDACAGVDYVLHQAALGSVPRSIQEPIASHASNVTGFLNMLVAARDAGVRRFVYASSSSVYGNDPGLPKVEHKTGAVLSPYAATKAMDEIYAQVFRRCYGLECVGLRYFNVFGPRQDPDGPYAAVIPKWIAALLAGESVHIHGDGETSRDFCYVANVVQANLLAATAPLCPPGATTPTDARGASHPDGEGEPSQAHPAVYNIAVGERTTLNQLFAILRRLLAPHSPIVAGQEPSYGPFRAGDVRHSLADIRAATRAFGYSPTHSISSGLTEALEWYVRNGRPVIEKEVRSRVAVS